ncbi:type I secretion system permease/ATPase [Candidatus Cardinium hertigii]|uniref:type I secretion system permease/ATPase n=1 Tax=Candidatus Cardinium hertigii TaxID=247481 RepID=UPI003D7DC2FB
MNQLITSGTYGIPAIIRAAQSFQIVVTEALLSHKLGKDCHNLSWMDVCMAAKIVGLQSKYYKEIDFDLSNIPLPILVCLDGKWSVIEKVEDGYWSRYDPDTDQVYKEPIANDTLSVILLAEQEIQIKDVKFGFNWFLPSILRHTRQLRDVLALSLTLQFMALMGPKLFQNVIDRVLVSRALSSLKVLSIAILSLAITEPIFNYFRGKFFTNLASKINSELSSRLYQHLLMLPLDYFSKRQTGQIVARVREMNHIRQFLTGSALMLILDSIFILIFLIVMFNYSSILTCIVMGSLVIYGLFWLTIGPMLRQRVNKEYDASVLATAYLTETITGIEVLKTTATESDFLKRWKKILACQLQSTFLAKNIAIVASQGISFIQKLTSALLLWFGVKIVLANQLTVGGLVAFNMLANYVTQPILRLAQIWQDFQHTLIALRRIGDILDTTSEVGGKGVDTLPKLVGKIEFQHVRFRYEPDTPEVVKNLSFVIQSGEFIGITGPSGSGKSTITRLLQRLYIPQNGQILVDGMDIAIANPTSLRRNMSIVLQDNMLFAGSILENIKLCCPSASEEEVVRSATLAGANNFINELPQAYQTIIGEKGSGLSGGQRQRIALARALLINPSILILDEATSALDYESEAAIMSNIDQICQNRTVIAIAHRLNTIKYANRILVLDQGMITEQGTHTELLQKKGLYDKLWRMQTNSI